MVLDSQVYAAFVGSVARWDGSTWWNVGGDFGGTVTSLAFSGGRIIAGGSFTSVGGVTANNLASWDGISWSSLGSGCNGAVTVMLPSGGQLYIGGLFKTAGGKPRTHIARWNGSDFGSLGSGVSGTVTALTATNSVLYAACITGNDQFIWRWDGSSWETVGLSLTRSDGIGSQVNALAVIGQYLYAGGRFNRSSNGTVLNQIARWDGSTWSALGSGVNFVYDGVTSMAVSGSDLYVGGDFGFAGGINVNAVAKWSGSAWSALGSGMNGTVRALAVAGTGLYVGGDFTQAGGGAASGVAHWNGSAWSALGSGGGGVRSLAVSGPDLYVGGTFTSFGGVSANYIARWNGSVWSALGGGVANYPSTYTTVDALQVVGSDLYAGGYFESPSRGIARWDGSAWNALGSGIGNNVSKFAVFGGELFAGGSINYAGGKVSPYLARAKLIPAQPVVELTEVSETMTSASLQGTVNPRGYATTAQFEYGTTSALGSVAAVVLNLNNANAMQAVSVNVTGLSIGTLYYYRLKATNSNGTTTTETGTFRTVNGGALDGTLSSDGIQITPFLNGVTPVSAGADSVVVQADGKILVAGTASNGSNTDFALVRYLADGTLDTTFGTGGRVLTNFGADDTVFSLALQSDGKAVVAGYATVGGNRDFALARYLTNGLPDSSFDGDGKLTTAFNLGGAGTNTDVASTVLIQPNGRIVALGYATAADGFHDVAVARYLTAGALDTSFDGDGKKTFPVGIHWDYASCGALLPDGKIVCGGVSTTSGPGDFFVARLLDSGALDTSFGVNGTRKVSIQTQDNPTTLLIQPDGKIVLGGLSDTASNGETPSCCLIRLNSDARSTDSSGLDTSFDGDGRALYPFGGTYDFINGICLQSDGKIVAVGTAKQGTYESMTVLRVNANGGLDTTFNSTGKLMLTPGVGNQRLVGVTLDAAENIVAVGTSNDSSGVGQFAVVRLLGGPWPQIRVRQSGTTLTNANASIDFGALAPGASPVVKTFEINKTDGNGGRLALQQVSLLGANVADFTFLYPTSLVNLLGAGPTTLGLGDAFLFNVYFTPSAIGPRVATLRIVSNDKDETPFDIELTGTGLTTSQTWRQQYFGSIANSGDGADLNDFEKDGLVNLLEFATGMHPKESNGPPGTAARNGSELEFTYPRANAAVTAGVQFIVEWSDSLVGLSWSSVGVTESVLSDNGTVQQVKATLPAGSLGRRFVRLRVVGN
jgi:uncharacterized delta-60 repeat protein